MTLKSLATMRLQEEKKNIIETLKKIKNMNN